MLFLFRFLEYPEMNLHDIIKDSSANKPIVLFKISNDVVSINLFPFLSL